MNRGNLHLISCKFVRTFITTILWLQRRLHDCFPAQRCPIFGSTKIIFSSTCPRRQYIFCAHLNITSPIETQQCFAHLEVLRFKIPFRLTSLLRLLSLSTGPPNSYFHLPKNNIYPQVIWHRSCLVFNPKKNLWWRNTMENYAVGVSDWSLLGLNCSRQNNNQWGTWHSSVLR